MLAWIHLATSEEQAQVSAVYLMNSAEFTILHLHKEEALLSTTLNHFFLSFPFNLSLPLSSLTIIPQSGRSLPLISPLSI